MTLEKKLQKISDRFTLQVGFEQVEAEFISTSNPRFDGRYKGVVAKLSLASNMAHFSFNSFHTSYIVQVYLEKDMLTCTTRNSTYVFKILDKELLEWFPEQGVLFELGDKEIEIIEQYLREGI